VGRHDGRELEFRAPSSGNVYIAGADVPDRLERLTDGSGNITGWKYLVAADDSSELYGPTGKLLSITDRAGTTLTLAYSDASTPASVAPAAGLLISVTDPWGRRLNFTYNSQQRIVRMTDPAGGNHDFAYDASGNPASVTFPDTKVRAFKYSEPEHTQGTALPHSLTGIVDQNGERFATFQYDTQGRAVSSEHAGGAQKVTLQYTSPGVSTTVTDALGVSRSYGLTTLLGVIKNNGITGSACPACGPAAQTYDANGNVASRTDWNGNRTNYAYDLARNLETARTEGLTAAGGTTPQTRTISTRWHASFRLPTGIAEPLRITTNVYDPDGTQCGARGALCSRSVQATSDASGSLGFSATPAGTARTWTYTYYANNDADLGKRGNVATVSNAAGHLTSITAYDAHGQPLTIVDPNGLTTTLTYDERQRLKTRTAGGELTSYDYDGVGQLTKVTLPDGSFLSYEYDPAHRLTEIQDNLGNRIAYTLDAMGNRTLEEVRDPANALAQKRSRVYNALNRLFQELGAQNQTTEYGYDDQGNVTSVKDPLLRVTSNQYDALNRLKQVTDPGLGVTQYAYNGLDALTAVTDPRNLVTGYSVDGLGNLTQQASPDTSTTVNTHDAAGNLLTQTDAKGQTTTYAYDALNRVTLITFHDGARQAYAYDQGTNGIGRLASITETDPANAVTSRIAYAYTPHGRVASETRTVNGVAYVLGYSYDVAGRLAGFTYPSGRTVTYGFDALGRVNTLSTTPPGGSAQSVVSNVAYHPFGGVKGFTLGNGQSYSRSIDLDGRIASYTLGTKAFGIGYDAASRIEFIADLAVPANSNTYGYDDLDRLTSAVTPGTPYAYGYDAVGNRTSRTAGSSTDTYFYGSDSNRIGSIQTPSGLRSFAFDPNGSTTADGNNTYVYDTRGRMVQATSSLGVTSYRVNALGQRMRKTNSLGDTLFHYDTSGRLIAETSPTGAVKRELIYLGDIPVGVFQ
jgi:YD repeat-containing protein